MDDYRQRVCLVNGTMVLMCIAQDFLNQKIYFALPENLKHLDCGYCTVPSFEVSEDHVKRLSDEEILQHIASQPKEE